MCIVRAPPIVSMIVVTIFVAFFTTYFVKFTIHGQSYEEWNDWKWDDFFRTVFKVIFISLIVLLIAYKAFMAWCFECCQRRFHRRCCDEPVV